MSENSSEKPKRTVPVLSFKEFLDKENGILKIKGPFKIKAEDKDIALEYFKKR